MNILCVDDEALVLQYTVAMIKEVMPKDTQISWFTNASPALEWADSHRVDLALLDIDMPGMNGMELAQYLKSLDPDTAVIFLTGYSQYAVEAFSMHVSGYLLKPVSREKLSEEISYALGGRKDKAPASASEPKIQAVCFGGFDLIVKGEAVSFSRSKSKELLAYLVDRQGSSITRAEAAAVLWEDSFYDRSMQKQLDVVIRSLRTTLVNYGIEDLLEIQKGYIRIHPKMLDCDFYRFIDGDKNTIRSYRGEYMSAYSWAEFTAAYLEDKAQSFRD